MEQLLNVSEDELAADRIMEDFTNQEDQVDKTDERRESFSAQYVFQLSVAIDRITKQIEMMQDEQNLESPPYQYEQ